MQIYYVRIRMATSICIVHLSAQLYVSFSATVFKKHKMNQLVREKNSVILDLFSLYKYKTCSIILAKQSVEVKKVPT